MGNSEATTTDSQPSKSSESCKSFGKVDPRKTFFVDIKTRCQTDHNFPAWDRLYDYNVYQTARDALGHTYVAICCVDESVQSEYLCVHLNVEIDGDHNSSIFPRASFMSNTNASEWVVNNKRSQKYLVTQVAMRHFTKLALDLIEHFGTYNKFSNSCQTFAASFVSKLQSCSDAAVNLMAYATTKPTVHQKACNRGKIIGALVVGPVIWVGAAVESASLSVAKKNAGNTAHKMQDPLAEKTEMEWMNWEQTIWNLS